MDRLPEPDVLALDQCITQLEQDPYPPPWQLRPLVIPHQAVYRDAFVCGDWGIAYHVEDHAFVVIDAIARFLPPWRGSP